MPEKQNRSRFLVKRLRIPIIAGSVKKKNDLVRDLMSNEGASIGKLRFDFPGEIWVSKRRSPPEWVRDAFSKEYEISSWAFAWEENAKYGKKSGALLGGLNSSSVDIIYRSLIAKFIAGDLSVINRTATYLPAARTGLMLALKELAASALDFNTALSDTSVRNNRLTAPMRSFLSSLVRSGRNSGGDAHKDIASFLQRNVYEGDLRIASEASPDFFYQPDNSSIELPMHAVSSMISELTPILALLRNHHIGSGLVIEEPEAHLHLSAQRLIARLIVRLVNAGVPVAVTTHSDTFLQQINILLRASELPRDSNVLQEMDLEEQDLLSRADVGVFEFICKDGETMVEESVLTEEGFVVSSINEALLDIADDVVEMDDLRAF